MNFALEPKRELLRHLVATVAFRGGLAVWDAPAGFSEFRIGETARTAGELLAHIGDLIEGSHHLVRGEFIYLQSPARSWREDVGRFFSAVREFDRYLASDRPLAQPIEKLVQGPVADALTHVGQIVMLRRLAGRPVREEGYFTAPVAAGRIDEEFFLKLFG